MDRPNILFILSEQHSKYHLGCYGEMADEHGCWWKSNYYEGVAQRSAELTRDAQVLTAWGQAVQPLHEDTLPVEDVEDVVRC